MSRSNAKKLCYLAAGAAILALFAAQGCSSDSVDQAKPTAGAPSTAGAGGKANAGAGGKTSGAGKGGAEEAGGTAPSEGGAGGEPGEGGMGGMGGEAGAPENCDGPKGCYSCTPTTNSQLLNHCVPGGCPATFDNNTLSKLNLVGTL